MAAGGRYRRLDLPNLAQFEGVGIYYGATRVEAEFCRDEEVAVVGGGNSAGQAAMFLSGHRQACLSAGARTLPREDHVAVLDFPDRSEPADHAAWSGPRSRRSKAARIWSVFIGETPRRANGVFDIRHVFVMTGADPNTEWLQGCLELDANGFIKTGTDVGAGWPLRRPPYFLESSLPGVFAVGDIRAGSIKRVASAVGEGSMAVQFVHKVLAE